MLFLSGLLLKSLGLPKHWPQWGFLFVFLPLFFTPYTFSPLVGLEKPGGAGSSPPDVQPAAPQRLYSGEVEALGPRPPQWLQQSVSDWQNMLPQLYLQLECPPCGPIFLLHRLPGPSIFGHLLPPASLDSPGPRVALSSYQQALGQQCT